MDHLSRPSQSSFVNTYVDIEMDEEMQEFDFTAPSGPTSTPVHTPVPVRAFSACKQNLVDEVSSAFRGVQQRFHSSSDRFSSISYSSGSIPTNFSDSPRDLEVFQDEEVSQRMLDTPNPLTSQPGFLRTQEIHSARVQPLNKRAMIEGTVFQPPLTQPDSSRRKRFRIESPIIEQNTAKKVMGFSAAVIFNQAQLNFLQFEVNDLAKNNTSNRKTNRRRASSRGRPYPRIKTIKAAKEKRRSSLNY